MTDNSATATLHGSLTVAGWQSRAEARNAKADQCDMTDSQGQEIRLEGETGMNEGFGSHSGDRVPNLNVTHVSKPPVVRTEPANTASNQNPLTAARSRGH